VFDVVFDQGVESTWRTDVTDRVKDITVFVNTSVPKEEGCLYEDGGTGRGLFLGVVQKSDGYYLRFTAGDGGDSNDASDSDTAVIMMKLNDSIANGCVHQIVAAVNMETYTIQLWINGVLQRTESSTGAFELDQWSGGNDAGFGVYAGDKIAAGGSTANWKGDVRSNLVGYNWFPTAWIDMTGMTATQSSTRTDGRGIPGVASRAIDGDWGTAYFTDTCSHTDHTTGDSNPWWNVDLGRNYEISKIKIANRGDDCCGHRLSGFDVLVDDVPCATNVGIVKGETKEVDCVRYGRNVKVTITNNDLTICEFQVMGTAVDFHGGRRRIVSRLMNEA